MGDEGLDRRQLELQLEVIRNTHRSEAWRLEPVLMDEIRYRAFEILDDLERAAEGDAELLEQIAEVREEIG